MRRLPSALFAAMRRSTSLMPSSTAVIVAEVKFREVAVQMLLFAMLVHAAHPALEDREIAFNRCSLVTSPPRIFVVAVLDGFVCGELGADFRIERAFVGMQSSLARDVIADEQGDRHPIGIGTGNVERANRSAAFDQGNNGALVFEDRPDFWKTDGQWS